MKRLLPEGWRQSQALWIAANVAVIVILLVLLVGYMTFVLGSSMPTSMYINGTQVATSMPTAVMQCSSGYTAELMPTQTGNPGDYLCLKTYYGGKYSGNISR